MEELKYLRERSIEQDKINIDLQRTIKQQQEDMNSLILTVAQLNLTNDKDGLISSPEPEERGKYKTGFFLSIEIT